MCKNHISLLTILMILWSGVSAQTPVVLPFFCDFEDSVENAQWGYSVDWWAPNITNSVNIGNAVSCSGENSLYISNDNGITNSYDTPFNNDPPLIGTVSGYRDIYFTPGYPKYQIAFDSKGGGSRQGFMKVYLDNTSISGYLSEADFWTHYNIIVDSSFVGTHRLQLLFDFNIRWNAPGAFDNISIKGVFHEVPKGLVTRDVTHHTAQLAWSSDTSEVPLSYLLAWRTQTDTMFTEILLPASDTTFFLSNLTASSWYIWKVKALYPNDEWSEWSSEKAFRTIAQLPFFCDFENETDNKCWIIRHGDAITIFDDHVGYFSGFNNNWFIGTPTNSPTNNLLYISSDNGITNSYSTSQYSVVWAFRDIYLEPGYTQYQLSLDFKGIGEAGNDYVKLFLDTLTEPTDFYSYHLPISLVQIGETLNLTDYWARKSYTVDSTHAGVQRLYILWQNNLNSGTNPPAAIDNISIFIPSCGVPSNLVSSPRDTTTTLSWSPGTVGNMSSYILGYKALGDSLYTELVSLDTFLTLHRLLPSTDYMWHVRSVCSSLDTSEWSSDAFFSTTQPLQHLPYLCTFDSQVENSQWTLLNGNSENQWVIDNAIGYGGGNALYISNDSGATHAYSINSSSSVWAYRDVCFDDNHLAYQLSFDFKGMGQNAADYMQAYIGKPAAPSGTATPNSAVKLGGQLSNANDWTHYSFILDSTYVGIQRIYFLWTNNNSVGVQPPAAVDNLFVRGVDCINPSNLAIEHKTDRDLTLSWSPPTLCTPAFYTVSIREAGSTVTTEFNTSDTFLVLNGLTSSMTYYCKVRSNCSVNAQSDWSSDICVKMLTGLPYICDFEDANENSQWSIVNSSNNTNNKWYIGNAVNYGGSLSLYVSNDNGVSNAYTTDNHTYDVIWAYRDIYVDSNYTDLVISFDCRAYGELRIFSGETYPYDFAKVFMGPPATPTSAYIDGPDGSTQIGDIICLDSNWHNVSVHYNSPFSGLQRIYFMWRNDGTAGTNPPAAFDNIIIYSDYCAAPNSIAVDSTSTNSISISFIPVNTINQSWEAVITENNQPIDTTQIVALTSPSYTFSNLLEDTQYTIYIRTNCGDTNSFWISINQRTDCAPVSDLPYTEDFDSYGTDNDSAFPSCWNRYLSSYPIPVISSEVSSSNIGSLMFTANSFYDSWITTPAFDQEIPFDSLQLDFKIYKEDGVFDWETLQVGVMTNPYDENSLVPVDTFMLSFKTPRAWVSYTILFDTYHGEGRYVAFKYHCPTYEGTVFIDDVVFSKRSNIGIPSHSQDCHLYIYPNPTTGKCTIRSEQYILKKIEVYDIYGKPLEILQINDYQTDIDLSSFSSGVYLVRVATEQGMVTKRIVKK